MLFIPTYGSIMCVVRKKVSQMTLFECLPHVVDSEERSQIELLDGVRPRCAFLKHHDL